MSRILPLGGKFPEPFLILAENRFASTAVSQFTASGTATTREMIFLYGPSGTGKSHLASCAQGKLLKEQPLAHSMLLTAGQFAADFASASAENKIPEWQAGLRHCDLFILEDVHALEQRPEAQQQLLSLIDDLRHEAVPIILTSRKSPGELRGFPSRLVNRFHAGVTALLRLPAQASRSQLLQHFSRLQQLPLTETAVQLLAEQLPISPRELRASVSQLALESRHTQSALNLDFVRRYLRRETPPPTRTLAEIVQVVARHFGISPAQLRARNRTQACVLPRHCAIFLGRELTACSLLEIGRYFGGRDHSTILYACRKVEQSRHQEPEIGLHLGQIRSQLGVQSPLPAD